METRLQELTTLLYQEGVEKAQAEGAQLVAAAKAEADQLVQDARAEAERIMAEANQAAEKLKTRVQSELKGAANQALALFRQELAAVLESAILKPAVTDALQEAHLIDQIVVELAHNWQRHDQVQLELLLPEARRKQLETWFEGKTAACLTAGVQVRFDGRFTDGFRVSPLDGAWVVSFTEKDVSALLFGQLKTKTRELLFPDN